VEAAGFRIDPEGQRAKTDLRRLAARVLPALLILLLLGSAALGQAPTPRAARLAAIRQILDEAVGALAGTDPRKLDSSRIRDLATAQAMAGDVSGALRSAGGQPPRSVSKAIALAQARAGNFEPALRLAATLPTWDRGRLVETVAQTQTEAGDLPGALRTAAAAGVDFVTDGILRAIAVTQLRLGDVAAAERTAAQIRLGSVLDEFRLVLARRQAEAGELAAALATAAAMRPTSFEREVTLIRVAEIQASSGDASAALRTARLLPPGVLRTAALLAVVQAQADAGRIQEANDTAQRLPDPLDRELAYARIAPALVRRGDAEGALRLLGRLADPNIQTSARERIAVERARAGDVPGALGILDVTGDDGQNRLGAVVDALLDSGYEAVARQMAAVIQDKFWQFDMDWRFALARAEAGDAGPVLAVARTIPGGAPALPDLRVSRLIDAAHKLLARLDDGEAREQDRLTSFYQEANAVRHPVRRRGQ